LTRPADEAVAEAVVAGAAAGLAVALTAPDVADRAVAVGAPGARSSSS
jgi:hypothetical protein